ncbi:hypothetical protein J7W01_14605 [Bacillus subtilis]|uniref:hypothetical protein n=1 Tax=Bacillus subtilis TaxID=1423 RepID=UPI0018A6F47D|nr:hypothetical protein [Bacillus subtilis]MBG9809112.1 hypothetical protein [Bacillus subtilis]QPG30411.1 hypothetical protein ITP52_17315 [Bacillus subtilis]QTM25162.1 hypothetical protein J7W01_14605 [Bacillus subtilis]ULN55686.1 hypothetical protein MID01_15450 [Bacillus subtilis]WOA21271.1 hypothetical protein RW107_14990 [Bacillus subtilis]
MTEEVKRLRCALAEAIAENERLKAKINWLEEGIEGVVGLVYKNVDDMSELYAEAERLDDLKEALK